MRCYLCGQEIKNQGGLYYGHRGTAHLKCHQEKKPMAIFPDGSTRGTDIEKVTKHGPGVGPLLPGPDRPAPKDEPPEGAKSRYGDQASLYIESPLLAHVHESKNVSDGIIVGFDPATGSAVKLDTRTPDQAFEGAVDFILAKMKDILLRKRADYGSENIRRHGEYGVVVRIDDKMSRLSNLLTKAGSPANESIEDSWIDVANYCILALCLREGTL